MTCPLLRRHRHGLHEAPSASALLMVSIVVLGIGGANVIIGLTR